MKKYLFSTLLISLWITTQVYPQSGIETGLPYLRNYSPKEYKAHAQNWAIVQDERGVMYFANGSGLLEYDGVSWRLLQLPSFSIIRAIARAENEKRGRIYVGGEHEFGYFEPDAIGQMHYISLIPFVPEALRDFGDTWTIHATGDAIYFQSRERLFRLTPAAEGREWHIRTWEPQTNFMFTFWLDHTLYVHQRNVGLMKMVADSLEFLSGSEMLGKDRVQVMLPFPDGKNYLLGQFDGSMFVYDGQTFTPFQRDVSVVNLLQNQTLYKGTVLADGSFALASASNGLAIMDTQGRLLRHLSQASGLQDNVVYAVHADRITGQLWLGFDKGITRVEITSPLSRYDVQTGLNSAVLVICRHQGRLYVGTSSGVMWLNPETSTFQQVQGLVDQTFGLISVGGELLGGASVGFFQINGDQAQDIRASMTGDYQASSMHLWREDPHYLFVALFDAIGVMRRSGDTWVDEGNIPGLTAQAWSFIEIADGRLWLGTTAQGVVRITFPEGSNSLTRIRNARIERFGSAQGLPAGSVAALSANGREYFVSLSGVFRFDESQQRFVPDTTFQDISRGGDPSEYRMVTDDRGRVWLNFGRETAVDIPQEDGGYRIEKTPFMPFADVGVKAILPEDNGIVWFGSSDGLTRYDSNLQKDYHADYSASIRRVIVAEDSLVFDGSAIAAADSVALTLAYSLNSIHFEYAAPFFEQENKTQYQTFLQGFDKNWSPWHLNTQKEYTNLPLGDYHFHVRARNIYQLPSQEAIFAFSILPPWYRTWWAYGGYVLMFAGLVFAADRVQRRRLAKKEAERSQLREAELRAEAAEEHRKNIEMLSKIGRDITATLSIKHIIDTTYANVNLLMDATVFGIGIYNEEEQLLEFPATKEKGETLAPFTNALDDNNRPAVWCFRNREELVTNDWINEYQNYVEANQPAIEGEDPASIIYLPLMKKDKAIGVITAQSFGKNAYTDFHVNVLRNLATYSAIALDNADAYRRLDDTQKQLLVEEQAKRELLEKELEAARDLQLSMLPKQMPDTAELDIAAYMKTATEVGGDYYDFSVADDGSTVVGIGDATGHGINAGMVVTTMKSLFLASAANSNLLDFFEESNNAMELIYESELLMGFQLLRIKDKQLSMSAGGMPPSLLYRAGSGEVEEIAIEALPLGGFVGYPYEQFDFVLESGDTLLMASDGYAELFNDKEQMFGYDTVRDLFGKIARHSSQDIIDKLVEAGDKWANGRPNDDDVTFVVVKVK